MDGTRDPDQFAPAAESGCQPPLAQPEYVVEYADAPRPAALTDPDHFAVSEEDYDSDNVLDRFYRWIAERVGVLTADEDSEDQVLAERTRRWTTRTIVFTALALLFLNGQSIRTWASTLEPSWASETLRVIATDWTDRLHAVGLDQPRAAIHDAYEAQKSRSWAGGGAKTVSNTSARPAQ